MVKDTPEKLLIDIGKPYDAHSAPLGKGFKLAIYAYYGGLALALAGVIYAGVHIWLYKQSAKEEEANDRELNSKIRNIQALEASSKTNIEKANVLMEWQSDNVHGQKLIHALLSEFSKEVVLERFNFKREKSSQQVSLVIDLKGNAWTLHQEFESIPQKLEGLGFQLISLDQVEIEGGMRLKCLCQLNIFRKEAHEKLY